MEFGLKGKLAVVTGGATGIGNAIARTFRGEGAVCFISSEAKIRSIGNMTPYSVTKTAILGLSRSLAKLTRGTKVRVRS